MNTTKQDENHTFQSIFLKGFSNHRIKVPDYQRAYSWESKQIDLFIGDLVSNANRGGYYFGHFIVEDSASYVELVDGQQRFTTVVLFLLVCQIKRPDLCIQGIFDLVERFETVGYDQSALLKIRKMSPGWLEGRGNAEPKNEAIIEAFSLEEKSFTYSQRRLALAVWQFHRAFEKGRLEASHIPSYIQMLCDSLCSCHVAKDKTVAVNIFEMHNTRGVPLKLIEVVKAKLMKAVYDEGGSQRDKNIESIQSEFAIIHSVEERLSVSSFRGEMTLEAILRHHLRVVDDGGKKSGEAMDKPPRNASSDDLIRYISDKLSATYAMALATELRKSAQIICDVLPEWDRSEKLVGDVMILHRGLSCEFFLLICRMLESSEGMADGQVSGATLRLWEKLLFTHDFHGRHHNLKGMRDNFPKLFSEFGPDEKCIAEVIGRYLNLGFRDDKTGGDLQKVVRDHLVNAQGWFLQNAFLGWRSKLIYALYKYEIFKGADIRSVMKETISVEHILPQGWDWSWIDEKDSPSKNFDSDHDREKNRRERGPDIDAFINGLGNLLLVTREQNSALSNEHPAWKSYLDICDGGSYAEHESNRECWKASEKWKKLIYDRGENIFKFILEEMLK
ncbi:MAG: DUF262 domain-containing HNH endonuclease family protein [Prosthecobacter sp.]|uniref:DUF262 domain-containing protein n=1 Tax=Prosthecobacter sp. TaxID=1965333 RepID=UPI003BB0A46A